MDRLACDRMSIAVMAAGSFVGGAQRLKADLGLRLMNCTARWVTPAEAGPAHYDRLRVLVEELDAPNLDIRNTSRTPRGRLRVTDSSLSSAGSARSASWWWRRPPAWNATPHRRRPPTLRATTASSTPTSAIPIAGPSARYRASPCPVGCAFPTPRRRPDGPLRGQMMDGGVRTDPVQAALGVAVRAGLGPCGAVARRDGTLLRTA